MWCLISWIVFFGFFLAIYCCTSNVIMVQSPSCGRRSVAPSLTSTPLWSRKRSCSQCKPSFLENVSWVCYVTLRSKHFTYFLLLMPEDLGGHQVSGPASPWDLEEFHSLQGVNEAARGAEFFLPFSKTFIWLARTASFRRPCCSLRTSSSGLLMFSPSWANAWAH